MVRGADDVESPMLPRRLTVVLLLLALALGWAFCLSWSADAFALVCGRHGVCPLRTVLWVVVLSCGFVLLISSLVAAEMRMNRASAVSIAVLLSLAGASWTLATLRESVASGRLLRSYCRGLSETVSSKIGLANLKDFLGQAILADYNDGGPYPAPTASAVSDLFPGSRPSVLTFRHPGESNTTVTVLWKCAGGGIGIMYRTVPPEKRTWLDECIMLESSIWIVTRSE